MWFNNSTKSFCLKYQTVIAIVAICGKMSTQAIISLTKTLSSLVRVKMIRDILKEDATDRNIDN